MHSDDKTTILLGNNHHSIQLVDLETKKHQYFCMQYNCPSIHVCPHTGLIYAACITGKVYIIDSSAPKYSLIKMDGAVWDVKTMNINECINTQRTCPVSDAMRAGAYQLLVKNNRLQKVKDALDEEIESATEQFYAEASSPPDDEEKEMFLAESTEEFYKSLTDYEPIIEFQYGIDFDYVDSDKTSTDITKNLEYEEPETHVINDCLQKDIGSFINNIYDFEYYVETPELQETLLVVLYPTAIALYTVGIRTDLLFLNAVDGSRLLTQLLLLVDGVYIVVDRYSMKFFIYQVIKYRDKKIIPKITHVNCRDMIHSMAVIDECTLLIVFCNGNIAIKHITYNIETNNV
ncbi:hypothetical protein PCE1_004327 [Barthelona sp. PCE]